MGTYQKKGGAGGPRRGGGRKRKVDEEWSRSVCINAITAKYGSVEEGIDAILSGTNERLQVIVWQHVLGVPETKGKVKLADSEGNQLQPGILSGDKIVVEVVRTVYNKDVPVDGQHKDDNSL